MIYEITPPMAVIAMKIEDVPIASLNVNPKRMESKGTANTPPPTPKRPDINPIEIPKAIAVNLVKGTLVPFPSLLNPTSMSTATMKSSIPNMNLKISDGTTLAKRPPQKLPNMPKTPKSIPGRTISLFFF